ncbi:GspH/FimT family pseudopilin [Hydrogenophaga sp.]|uniref:GspH/FimT family pseudopilin n=1 Tax=Hydrogenophaga sp. TaxID=1904254 RepID=UPI002FCA00B2
MTHSLTHIPNGAPLRQRGVTMIELMVGVVILAILLAVAVPSFQSAIASSRLTTTTNDLVSALSAARSEAIRRGSRVTVCKSSDGTQCTTTGNWSQGWIVYTDPTRPSTDASVDTGEVILATGPASATGIVLAGTTGMNDFVSYAADGQPKLMNGTAQSGRIRVCNASGALANTVRARDVEVSTTGRLFTTTPSSVAATCPLS